MGKCIPICCCLVGLLSMVQLQAQMADKPEPRKSRIQRSHAAIQELKDGILVVRLKSNKKKIAEIQKVLQTEDVGPAREERLRYLLSDTKDKTHLKNTAIIHAFGEFFDFCEVRFMYDYDTPKLKTGAKKGYFLNKSLEFDPTIQLDTSYYMVSRFDRTSEKEGGPLYDAIIISDSEFEDLVKPFPYYVIIGNSTSVTNILFPQKNPIIEEINGWVNTLNSELHKKHQKLAYKMTRMKYKEQRKQLTVN